MLTFAYLILSGLSGFFGLLIALRIPVDAPDDYRETVSIITLVMIAIALCAAFAGGYGVQ
ncbi:hypothetical protein SAMN02745157_4829 [Kaistia soli DSM 19436]|uniref:Uncharacterized protein n=1 Tax=Kaistia soli DSM 19436 TaxID=1122133 RepID=A0A1M5MP20_9HYPH|nr:hypothetical protein [Kaistia soli]SHG78649.1 hypothetical protein SAMN02745157_4829 [Kaistia soli DSM 19436]